MNTTRRLLLGVLSSLLLAVGLARAADRFDPIGYSLQFDSNVADDGLPTPGCADPCVPCSDDSDL